MHFHEDPPALARPIGIFDSGVGGLTVLSEVQRQLPSESILYFADTAHLPYGTRSAREICQYVREILGWYHTRGVKRVLMACNTSSALALDVVAPEFAMPVDGLILAAARVAVGQGRRIGVIATEATVRSQAYTRAIRALAPGISVWEVGCPRFVPLVESGRLSSDETRLVARQYLAPLLAQQIDTLIYGCTHYPYLAPVLDEILPERVRRVNPAVAAAAQLRTQLHSSGTAAPADNAARCEFWVSGDPGRFAWAARTWLGYSPVVQSVQPSPTAVTPT
ncbi:MAG: glutamate racemase [Gemmatimonadaceae bacterium]|nr:glutamate racemase [Gloeobacterales cyanobacterium ES-bin-141]